MVAPMLSQVTRGDGVIVRDVSSYIDETGEMGTIPTGEVGYRCWKSLGEAREA